MTQSTQNESGADLFARLVSQKKFDKTSTQSDPKLTQLEHILMINKALNIDANIFPDGINNKEIVEICGRVGVGKSEFLLHLIARCLIPKNWVLNLDKFDQNVSLTSQTENLESNFTIDLSELSYSGQDKLPESNEVLKVILIETDSKLNMFRLFSILENRLGKLISKLCEQQTGKLQNFEEIQSKLGSSKFQKLMQKFIKECLKNLTVYQCFNSEQFIMALCACEHFVQSLIANKTVRTCITPIFIDSINSNFETFDKYNNSLGLGDYDHTEKYTVQLIKKLIDRYNVCVIASRSDFRFIQSECSSLNNSYRKWQLLVNKKVELVLKSCEDKRAIDGNEPQNLEIGKKRFLKLIEFIRTNLAKNEKQTDRMIKENIEFWIENIGFNLH